MLDSLGEALRSLERGAVADGRRVEHATSAKWAARGLRAPEPARSAGREVISALPLEGKRPARAVAAEDRGTPNARCS
jgi:hypothetical protein